MNESFDSRKSKDFSNKKKNIKNKDDKKDKRKSLFFF
jgi:hypothetical protein